MKHRNILTIKGKSYKKKDILAYKKYFDSIDEKRHGALTQQDYVKSVSKSNHLKRIAVSMFNFLDRNKDGKVTFPELL